MGCTFLKQTEGPGSEISSVWSSAIDEGAEEQDEDGEQDLSGFEDDPKSARTEPIVEEEEGQEEHALTPVRGRASKPTIDRDYDRLKVQIEDISKEKDALQSKVIELMEALESNEEAHLLQMNESEAKIQANADALKRVENLQAQLAILEKEKQEKR